MLVGWVAYGQDEEGEESLIWVSFFLVGKEINKRFAWDFERERERELTARAGGKPLRTSPSPPVLLQGATSADTNTMFIILQTGMMAL